MASSHRERLLPAQGLSLPQLQQCPKLLFKRRQLGLGFGFGGPPMFDLMNRAI